MLEDPILRDLVAAALGKVADRTVRQHVGGMTQEAPLTARVGQALETTLERGGDEHSDFFNVLGICCSYNHESCVANTHRIAKTEPFGPDISGHQVFYDFGVAHNLVLRAPYLPQVQNRITNLTASGR